MNAENNKTVYKNSLSNIRIDVQENRVKRSLYFSETILQSSMDKSAPHKLIIDYTRFMMLPLLLQIPQKILIIGLGAGSFLRFFHYHFKQIEIDAVDNCDEILKIAKKYFFLPQSEKINLHNCCGNEFLSQTKKRYDLILIDSFDKKGMAKEIYNEKTLTLCNEHLTESGILCCNIWSNDLLALSEIKEIIDKVNRQTLYIPVPNKGNIIGIGSNRHFNWQSLHPKNPKLISLEEKLEINFTEMVKIARRTNMSLWQRACKAIF